MNLNLKEKRISHFRYCKMDVYWELSDFDIHTRQQGIEKLLESLKTLSTNDDNGKVYRINY